MKPNFLLWVFLPLLCLPAAGAVGIGALNTYVPVIADSEVPLTVYLTNTESRPVTVDVVAEGELRSYVAVPKKPVTLQPKQILPVELTVTFGKTPPMQGGAMIIATERNQPSAQIGAIVRNAVVLRFDFSPPKQQNLLRQPVLQQPAPPPQTPEISIGDYLATSAGKRTFAISSAALLAIIAVLVLGFDVQVLWHRKKSREEMEQELKK